MCQNIKTQVCCICGYFNAHIGSLVDTNIEFVPDFLPNRAIIDTAVPNTHGREFIDFLRDVGDRRPQW